MPDFIGPLSHHVHSSHPVSYKRAQKWINAYTSRSQSSPHMHPDALLARKITFGTNGQTGGVTMSQLRKVSRGLSGERMTPEPEALPTSKDGNFPVRRGKRKTFEDEASKGNTEGDGTRDSEWEDADKWALERNGDEVGEVGQRHNYVQQVEGDEEPDVETAAVRDDNAQQIIDKAQRKAAKKEKRKAEKKESEAKRRKGAMEED